MKPTDAQRHILAQLNQPGWKIVSTGQRAWLLDAHDALRQSVNRIVFRHLMRARWIEANESRRYVITDSGKSVAPASPRWMP